jgi:peptide deformylase
MAVKSILLFPNEILAAPCRPVEEFGASLASLILDLRDTMYSSPGVGLAAPQIGLSVQVSVIDVTRPSTSKTRHTGHGFLELVNPKLVHAEGLQIPREGCLSVPELLGNVRRHQKVVVRTYTIEGKTREIRAEGFEALALQHEIDHLDGRLFLDRIQDIKTDIFRRKRPGKST